MSDIVVISPKTHRWLPGNEDFTKWLRDNDVDPTDLASLAIDMDNPTKMTVMLYKKDSEGKRYIEGRSAATSLVEVVIKVPFPMRFLDPKTAR